MFTGVDHTSVAPDRFVIRTPPFGHPSLSQMGEGLGVRDGRDIFSFHAHRSA